jgi:histidyl-tRNA synthetase
MGMKAVLVLGPDELAQGRVTLKDLTSGTQEGIERSTITQAVMRIVMRILERH